MGSNHSTNNQPSATGLSDSTSAISMQTNKVVVIKNRDLAGINHALELYNQHRYLCNQENYEQALAQMHELQKLFSFHREKLLEIAPDFEFIMWGNQTECLFKLNKLDDVINAADEALKLKFSKSVLSMKQLACLALGRTDEALSACEKALENDPTDIVSMGNKIITLFKLKRYPEMIDLANRFLAMDLVKQAPDFYFIGLENKLKVYDPTGKKLPNKDEYNKVLEELFTIGKDKISVQILLYNLCLELKNDSKILEVIDRLLKFDADRKLPAEILQSILPKKISILEHSGKYKAAIDAVDHWIKDLSPGLVNEALAGKVRLLDALYAKEPSLDYLVQSLRIIEQLLTKRDTFSEDWIALLTLYKIKHFSLLGAFQEALEVIKECKAAFCSSDSEKNQHFALQVLGTEAQIFIRMGKYDQAKEICEILLQKLPNDSALLYLMSKALYELNHLEKGHALIDKVIAQYKGNNDDQFKTEIFLFDHISLLNIYNIKISTCLYQLHLDEMFKTIEEATQEIKLDKTYYHYQKGIAFYYKGALAEAHDTFSELVKSRPKETVGWLNLHEVCRYQNDHQKGQEALQQADALNSNYTPSTVGYFHLLDGEYAKAHEAFNKGLQNSQNARAQSGLGFFLFLNNELFSAQHNFNLAYQNANNRRDKAFALLGLALLDLKHQKLNEAEQKLQEANTLDHSLLFLEFQAMCFLHLKDYDRPLCCYKRLLDLVPHYALASEKIKLILPLLNDNNNNNNTSGHISQEPTEAFKQILILTKRLESANYEKQCKIDVLQTENTQLKQHSHEQFAITERKRFLENEVEQLNHQLKALMEEHKQLKSADSNSNLGKKQEGKYRQLEQTLKKTQEELKQATLDLKQKEKIITQKDTVIAQLQVQIEKLTRDINTLKKEHEQAMKRIEEKHDLKMSEMKRDLNKERQKRKQSRKELNDVKDDVKELTRLLRQNGMFKDKSLPDKPDSSGDKPEDNNRPAGNSK